MPTSKACNRTGQTYDPSNEHYSTYPRAICEETEAPHKGSKAVWTDKLEKRYSTKTCESTPVITHVLPREWVPEVIILDAMFLIQCSPLRQTMTIMDYAKLLLNRFVIQHYQAGVNQVHVLFDCPSQQHFNPKVYEQIRRDTSCVNNTHELIKFQPWTKV